MKPFEIKANHYLSKNTTAFYHERYIKREVGAPTIYLNDMKNTYNNYSLHKLRIAAGKLQGILKKDIPQILQSLGFDEIVVCVVPRAKAENFYQVNQRFFKHTVQDVIGQYNEIIDGTNYIRRHTDTRTTHLPRNLPEQGNQGDDPYPGITEKTCEISSHVRGKNILLIDDIYTPGINIDEDAINALLKAGANTVSFYAIGRTFPEY